MAASNQAMLMVVLQTQKELRNRCLLLQLKQQLQRPRPGASHQRPMATTRLHNQLLCNLQTSPAHQALTLWCHQPQHAACALLNKLPGSSKPWQRPRSPSPPRALGMWLFLALKMCIRRHKLRKQQRPLVLPPHPLPSLQLAMALYDPFRRSPPQFRKLARRMPLQPQQHHSQPCQPCQRRSLDQTAAGCCTATLLGPVPKVHLCPRHRVCRSLQLQQMVP
ncbi:hypothetical protein V8C86DRAFT_2978274 [Haematococcus lacustris]